MASGHWKSSGPPLLALALLLAAASPARAGHEIGDWTIEFPRTDFYRRGIDLSEIVTDGPRRDQIPPIHDPQFVAAADRPVAVLDRPGRADRSALSAFRVGLLTQLANPKVVVFFGSIFLALLPAGRPHWMTAALLAVVFVDEFIWYAGVALAFSVERLKARYLRLKRVIDRVTGGFLGLLGLRMLT